MGYIDITPDTKGVIRWAKQGLRGSEPDSKSAEAFRNILRECGVDIEGAP